MNRLSYTWNHIITTRSVVTFFICTAFFAGAPASANDRQGLTPEAAFRSLTTQANLARKLHRIERRSYRYRFVKVGPLIRNGNNRGLINIDVPLDVDLPIARDVCGASVSPTLRQAVICTIEEGGRGNIDPDKVGFSNKGQALLAARIGNRYAPARVLVITQQHGNEVAGTEAAIKILKRLSRGWGRWVREVVTNLDILFIVRANPDGGNPAPECATRLPVAAPFFGDCAVTRTNLDPAAGGGFKGDSEPGFFGVVGQGYNLNRYHHVGLDNPIRPVENQAMVAAALAFRPDYVLDLHGDVTKTDCNLDANTVSPNSLLGFLPTIKCLPTDNLDKVTRKFSVFATTPTTTAREIETRALGAAILERVAKVTKGSVGRFSQLQLGAGTANNATADAYQLLGALTGGWESTNFGVDGRPDVQAIVNGVPQIAPNTFLIDSANLKRQVWLNVVALRTALKTIARFQWEQPRDEGSFCDFPLANGLNANLPRELWGQSGTTSPVIVPTLPVFGLPLFISGSCPQDNFSPLSESGTPSQRSFYG